MKKILNAILLTTAFLVLVVACKKDHTNLKGIWVGIANVKPFPEFIKLNYDSIPNIRLYYNRVDQETVIDFDGKNVSFPISEGMLGLFEGQLDQDTLKGYFLLEQLKKDFPCNLVRVHPTSMADISQLTGLYRVAPKHVIEVIPAGIDQDLITLKIVDHLTGKERIAFPTSPNTYVAGPEMFNPYPVEMSFKVVGADSKQVPGIEFTDEGLKALGL